MPSSRVPSLALLIGFLSAPEQRSMQLDGEAVAIAHSSVSVSEFLTPERKTELACAIDAERFVLSGWSALWAAGLCSEPSRHDVVLRPGMRPRGHAEDELAVHELVLREGDLIDYGVRGGRLHPLRALCDVLRFDEQDDERLILTVLPLIEALGVSTAHVREVIATERALPYSKRALRRLALIDAINVVDTVDSAYGV